MKKLILLFTLSLLLVGMAWGANLVDENIQSWTNRGSYGNYTETITAGTVNMTDCIVANAASTTGTCTAGRVQMKASTGILQLPELSSIGTISFNIVAGGADRSIKLQKLNGTTWIDITTFSGIGTTGATYTHDLNTSSATQIRLATPSSAVYVHDILVTDNAGGAPTPTISITPAALTGFSYQTGNGPSATQTFTVSGTNLTANISLAASSNYEISLNAATGYTTPLVLSPTSGTVAQTTIYVRLKAGLAAGDYNAETINISSTGAGSQSVTCSGTVSALGAPNPPVANDATNITTNSFSANWTAVSGATNYYLDVYTKVGSGNASDLFISEYIEGSSNNKYIEIYNGTAGSVDLSGYSLKQYNNGSSAATYTLALTGALASGSVYVIAHSSANIYGGTPDLSTAASAMGFNGNDAMALFNGTTVIDVVGPIGDATDWGKDVTLVRKANAPVPSATYTASDWDSYAADTVSYLGSHTFSGGSSNSFVSGYENRNVGNVISYAVTGLNSLTDYYYVVRSSNANGTSANSNEKTATTTAGSNPPPAPVATSATSIGQNSFVANWDAAATATSYRLDVSTVNTFASFVAGYNNLTVNSTSQTVSGLAANALYYYRIRAYNSYGTSSSSNVISAN
ncbi:MAG: lamin tail domain-containing protein, partial [Candidatus Cloacimonadaceae bacterium]|nr:lamin tail domain-containing protein [Candidatus Cloacimonadaceae bacterium]